MFFERKDHYLNLFIDFERNYSVPNMVVLFDSSINSLQKGQLTPDKEGLQYIPRPSGLGGYFGPRPFSGHGIHHYWFNLYALESDVDLEWLLNRIDGHILGKAHLVGSKKS